MIRHCLTTNTAIAIKRNSRVSHFRFTVLFYKLRLIKGEVITVYLILYYSQIRLILIFAGSMAERRTVAFHTLGCKLNFSETSSLSRLLEAEGFEKREFQDRADVYVINTCSVTDNADKECR